MYQTNHRFSMGNRQTNQEKMAILMAEYTGYIKRQAAPRSDSAVQRRRCAFEMDGCQKSSRKLQSVGQQQQDATTQGQHCAPIEGRFRRVDIALSSADRSRGGGAYCPGLAICEMARSPRAPRCGLISWKCVCEMAVLTAGLGLTGRGRRGGRTPTRC